MVELVGKDVGGTGFGLMGFTWRPTITPDEQAFKAMKASLASGCNLWVGGELYGTPEYNSLHLLEKYFTKYPEDASKVVLSIKGGFTSAGPDGSPEGVRRSVDNCLKVLNGKKFIDIFEMARVDKSIPLETTIKALEEYVKEGKIGGIALSEVGASTIHKAAGLTKIVAVEVELSLWSTDIFNNGVAAACTQHSIPVVAYSPIGRGFLTGHVKSVDDIKEGDMRKHMPRFQQGAFEKNLELVDELKKVAEQKSCTAAQLAISWVKSQSRKDGNPVIVPIPGATTAERVLENGKDITLSIKDLAEINAILAKFEVVGGRYGGPSLAFVEG